jgi:hypothetical protein
MLSQTIVGHWQYVSWDERRGKQYRYSHTFAYARCTHESYDLNYKLSNLPPGYPVADTTYHDTSKNKVIPSGCTNDK